jgi:hypothetical protein
MDKIIPGGRGNFISPGKPNNKKQQHFSGRKNNEKRKNEIMIYLGLKIFQNNKAGK